MEPISQNFCSSGKHRRKRRRSNKGKCNVTPSSSEPTNQEKLEVTKMVLKSDDAMCNEGKCNVTPSSSEPINQEKLEVTKMVLKSDDAMPNEGNCNITPSSSEPINQVKLKVTRMALKSDDVMWDLYERWCSRYKPNRTADEKLMRFKFFRKHAFKVREMNKKKINGGGYVLTKHADLTSEERVRFRCCGLGCIHTEVQRQRRLNLRYNDRR